MYIIVFDRDVPAVVASAKGVPREFPKARKVKNFMQGRPRLRDLCYEIVEDISEIPRRLKVDL